MAPMFEDSLNITRMALRRPEPELLRPSIHVNVTLRDIMAESDPLEFSYFDRLPSAVRKAMHHTKYPLSSRKIYALMRKLTEQEVLSIIHTLGERNDR